MQEGGTFDRLAAGLNLEERRELFDKLSAQQELSRDLLFREDELPAKVDLEGRYRASPWYYRSFLFLVGLFKNKPPLRVFEDHLIAKLGVAIEGRAPGLFDHRRTLLLPGLLEELGYLKQSARFFYDALDAGVGRDKGAFFSFLASIELDFVHRRLLTEVDPRNIAESNSFAPESEIRQQANRALEEILQSINEDERRTMYRNARSLHCLRELSSFLFDRLVTAFSGDPTVDGPVCPGYLAQDQLSALNNILYSLQEPPSLALLESLFVFVLQDRLGEKDIDIGVETRALLVKAEESLTRIRQFNRRVPLTAILRCTSRNLAYLPQVVSGGEDWFAVYRDHWKKNLEERLTQYLRERRRTELAEVFNHFFKGAPLKPLDNAVSSANPGGFPLRRSFALMFLAAFYQHILIDELNKVLRPILVDGEFYKRENRAEFTDAYNELLKLGDAIRALDIKLAPDGEIGRRYAAVQAEFSALAFKRRQQQSLTQDAADEAAGIIDRAGNALRSLISIFNGLVNGDAGGRYDSLANLGSLAGKGGSYTATLRGALQKFEKTVQLLGEIEAMEAGR